MEQNDKSLAPADRPYLVVTSIMDAAARPAAVTVSHGNAMERAYNAVGSKEIAGLDLIELPVAPRAFAILREKLGYKENTVAVYDLFPLSSKIDAATRKIAGQFLASEALWALEEQGHLASVPLNLKLDTPKGWDKSPQAVHEKLVEVGVLELSEGAISLFKQIRDLWTASAPQ